jgi:hypothetical protein
VLAQGVALGAGAGGRAGRGTPGRADTSHGTAGANEWAIFVDEGTQASNARESVRKQGGRDGRRKKMKERRQVLTRDWVRKKTGDIKTMKERRQILTRGWVRKQGGRDGRHKKMKERRQVLTRNWVRKQEEGDGRQRGMKEGRQGPTRKWVGE